MNKECDALTTEDSNAIGHTLHGVANRHPFAANSASLQDFVKDWERGTLPKTSWTHGAHVGVAAYYAFEHSAEALFQIMKLGIRHYNLCVGTPNTEDSGYHETLTRFWAYTVGTFVHTTKFASPLEAARNTLARFGEDRKLYLLYYGFDVMRDRRARREWIAPDREPTATGK
jgi:hypothetical protein